MKQLSFIFLLLFMLISCKDVLNSDRNVLTEPKDGKNGLSYILEFHFAMDTQIIKNNDTVNLGGAIIPYTWSKTFYINNISKDSLITITDIGMAEGKYFSVYSLNQLPLQIYPNAQNNSNQFNLLLRTKDLNPGIYIDKVKLNQNYQLGFYVKISVY